MSLNWAVPIPAQDKTGKSWLRRLGTLLQSRWIAYCEWRLEQIAIDQLNAMTDRELRDIGLNRSDIGLAVKLGPTSVIRKLRRRRIAGRHG